MKPQAKSDLENLQALARIMDSQFTIPGTRIRFGLDGLLGLMPGVGDLVTLLASGFIMLVIAKHGVSGYVLAKVGLNILIDSLIGAIPIVGDIFDIGFKANQRNVKLLQEHYNEGRHQGSAMRVIVPVLIILLLLAALVLWLSYRFVAWLIAVGS